MVDKWDEHFKIVERNVDVPSGKGGKKSELWETMIQSFLASGDKTQKLELTTPQAFKIGTVRTQLQRLARGEGTKKKGVGKIPAGKYYGQVEISVVKNFVYMKNLTVKAETAKAKGSVQKQK